MGRGFAFSLALLLTVITAIVAPSCRASVTVRGVDPALFERYIAVDGKFKCLDGTKTISYSYVNDGYCDCVDGSDEPGTAACINGNFYCQNIGSEPVVLNATFVDDGVCGKDGENGDLGWGRGSILRRGHPIGGLLTKLKCMILLQIAATEAMNLEAFARIVVEKRLN